MRYGIVFSELHINKDLIRVYEDYKGKLRYESKVNSNKGLVHTVFNNGKNIYYIKMGGKNFIIDL